MASETIPIQFVECPRDAMQGWDRMIPTDEKVAYLNKLLRVGFDVLDFGSFVSAKAIPQLADTHEVVKRLDLSDTATRLLAIVANTRGASEAVGYEQIACLGFPFSISETFQMRNTNKTISESLGQVEEMQSMCLNHSKELVVYVSMGFGNPYGDEYSAEIALKWARKLAGLGVKNIALADTVGVGRPETISYLFSQLIPEIKDVQFGAHFHSLPDEWEEKISTAYSAGCRRFDSALKGIGGCPMAEDELVGNIATENLLGWCSRENVRFDLNLDALREALEMAVRIFVK